MTVSFSRSISKFYNKKIGLFILYSVYCIWSMAINFSIQTNKSHAVDKPEQDLPRAYTCHSLQQASSMLQDNVTLTSNFTGKNGTKSSSQTDCWIILMFHWRWRSGYHILVQNKTTHILINPSYNHCFRKKSQLFTSRTVSICFWAKLEYKCIERIQPHISIGIKRLMPYFTIS